VQPDASDSDLDIIALSFAIRQILSVLDRDLMISKSLESLADLGRSDRVGLWLLDGREKAIQCEGGLIFGESVEPLFHKSFLQTPVAEVIAERTPEVYPLVYEQELPWPASAAGIPGRQCLCLPLIAADNRAIGVVTIDQPAGFSMGAVAMQILIVLTTVVAIGLETARLFRLAVIDGLTGLYLRRYMELRLEEEENRIRRYGGQMALLMIDIDHFKKLNDTYGHQQGDVVLQEMAKMMQSSVRKGLDVVCRYGGEEFVVIMPNTDAAGAVLVAEKIRRHCEETAFSGQGAPLHVTLSGGAASMAQQMQISSQELLRRADEALYRAKHNGRNRICLW
jgi:diguanylate cyclase (GGDEF)-like protein